MEPREQQKHLRGQWKKMSRSRCIVTGDMAHDNHHIRVPGDGAGRKPPDSRCIPLTREVHALIHNGGMTLQEQAVYRILAETNKKEQRKFVAWLASFMDKGDTVRFIKEAFGG